MKAHLLLLVMGIMLVSSVACGAPSPKRDQSPAAQVVQTRDLIQKIQITRIEMLEPVMELSIAFIHIDLPYCGEVQHYAVCPVPMELEGFIPDMEHPPNNSSTWLDSHNCFYSLNVA